MSKKQNFGEWEVQNELAQNCHTRKLVVKKRGQGQRFVLNYLYVNKTTRFEREVKAMKRLDHPNIIPLIDCDLSSKSPYYVTEYYNSSLEKSLRNWDLEKLNEQNITHILNMISKAVGFMHSQGVTHNALSRHKIILLKDNKPVIRYFWMAKVWNNHFPDTTRDLRRWVQKAKDICEKAKNIRVQKIKKQEKMREVQRSHKQAQPSAPARLSAE